MPKAAFVFIIGAVFESKLLFTDFKQFWLGYEIIFFAALVMAVRDINRLVGTVLRFMFYLTPILWTTINLPPIALKIIRMNPFIYIIEGFRNTFLYNKWFFEDIRFTIYYWLITILTIFIGALIHMKLRNRFSDLV